MFDRLLLKLQKITAYFSFDVVQIVKAKNYFPTLGVFRLQQGHCEHAALPSLIPR